jgi:hypothetical protein
MMPSIMAKRSSFGPLVLVTAALSCSLYVACGDDDVIIGTPGLGGSTSGNGGTAGSGGGGAGQGGSSAGIGGGVGGAVEPDAGDAGDASPIDSGADVGTTSNG